MFPKHDYRFLSGFCPIGDAQDDEVCKLISPMVWALLGNVVCIGQPTVSESTSGMFPGDSASNINRHAFFGFDTAKVRYPYTTTVHITENGAIVIRRDPRKVQVRCFLGDIFAGEARLIHVASLRERRFDGSSSANDCALLSFNYDHPVFHARLLDGGSLEFSVYSWSPQKDSAASPGQNLPGSSPGLSALGLNVFVNKPQLFFRRPELFRKRFDIAFQGTRAPGQISAPVPDVSKLIIPAAAQLARSYNYDFLEAAASWYHVVLWFVRNGFRYNYAGDAFLMQQLADGLKSIQDTGLILTRAQQSWVALLQSLRPTSLIPPHLNFNGPRWPVDQTGDPLIWLNMPLSAKAALLVPKPLERA